MTELGREHGVALVDLGEHVEAVAADGVRVERDLGQQERLLVSTLQDRLLELRVERGYDLLLDSILLLGFHVQILRDVSDDLLTEHVLHLVRNLLDFLVNLGIKHLNFKCIFTNSNLSYLILTSVTN